MQAPPKAAGEKRVACAGIMDGAGRILLQDRTGRSKYGEEWSFFGGGIEPGETPIEALLRELREELDWEFPRSEATFLGEIRHDMPDRILYRRFVFAVPTDRNEGSFKDLEGSGARFFDITSARGLGFNTDVAAEFDMLERFLAGRSMKKAG